MKIFIIVILLSASMLSAQSFSIQTDMSGMTMKVEENTAQNAGTSLIDEIVVRLEKLETIHNAKLNKVDQKKSGQLINEIYELLSMMPDDVNISIVSTEKNQPAQSPESSVNINIQFSEQEYSEEQEVQAQKETVNAMSEAEFKKLKSNVENESFADDQISVIRIAAKNKYFTIDQLIRLLSVFSFAEDKIEAVRIVYPKVVDPDNAHNLMSAFTYSDDKKTVENIISQ